MDQHRRVSKAAVSDLWTAVGLMKTQNLKRLRAANRQRARAFAGWWAARMGELARTDPALEWVWTQRNVAQHAGDDVAIWDWRVEFSGWSPPVGVPVNIQMGIDPYGNVTANGEPIETSAAFHGATVRVIQTVTGAAVPERYAASTIPDLLADALASAESIRAEIARDWA